MEDMVCSVHMTKDISKKIATKYTFENGQVIEQNEPLGRSLTWDWEIGQPCVRGIRQTRTLHILNKKKKY